LGQRREIVDALRSFRRVGFDTPVFVYHIEQTSRWAAPARAALEAMTDGEFSGMTSVLTLLEISIKPLRLGRPEIADAYEALIGDITNLTINDVDMESARIGAELRAAYGLRTPDSLHVAACLTHGAEAFVTNDRRLRRVKEIEIVMLDDFA
jgi:predicted nucleic acid-binding protein